MPRKIQTIETLFGSSMFLNTTLKFSWQINAKLQDEGQATS